MHLGPSIWGPHLWKTLHMISISYPNEPNEEQKKNYRTFFENFYQVIPCSICSNNYINNLKELPITNDTMKNQENLVKWVIDIHNIVNKELGKPIIEHDDALLLIYNNFDNSYKHLTQNKEKENKGNKEKENKEESKEKEEKEDKEENEENKSLKTSYTLWSLLIIFFILISIAIVYKKN